MAPIGMVPFDDRRISGQALRHGGNPSTPPTGAQGRCWDLCEGFPFIHPRWFPKPPNFNRSGFTPSDQYFAKAILVDQDGERKPTPS